MSACVHPERSYVGCNEVLALLVGANGARLGELGSLPLGSLGHELVALRYFIANGATWLKHFSWEEPLARISGDAVGRIRALHERIVALSEAPPVALDSLTIGELAARIEPASGRTDEGLKLLIALHGSESGRASLRERLRREAPALEGPGARVRDVAYLATYELNRLPATTVEGSELRWVIVADKGEMGARAVREALAFGAVPVVLFNATDDANALQVRLAEGAGGFTIGLEGNFRESYANPVQIASKVRAAYEARFGADAELELRRSALYPGYGPLAENTAAIRHFRREGIVFVGPAQDSVERAGDKRKFRALAEAIDERSVTPGIVIDETDADAITHAIHTAHAAGRFSLPGRVKAANGGGGRGQVIVHEPETIATAVRTVLGQIASNGWDPGVMFEQNVPETVHLEVQIVRDRYGNARHFGMRDCTEQRASQKIQEEAPPALLRNDKALADRCCAIAIEIAHAVGYVGACTVELMYKDGHVYLLEMNTRIQVEHPVTEEAHRIRTGDGLVPLDLVQIQLAVAAGKPIGFAQEDIVPTHAARELRINAEAWNATLKDPRDGKRGMFVPNAGIFDVMEIPEGEAVLARLREAGVAGIDELRVRFDVGFEVGDTLVNKDPTFGKLIVAVKASPGHEEARYELLRLACLEMLRQTRIEGRQVMPTGAVIEGSTFATNLTAHVQVLESDMIRRHGTSVAQGRHVNWVIEMLRTPLTDALA
jgi:acetyl/propionyl-CoA carboxylase alpha subunit